MENDVASVINTIHGSEREEINTRTSSFGHDKDSKAHGNAFPAHELKQKHETATTRESNTAKNPPSHTLSYTNRESRPFSPPSHSDRNDG
jgi:hypothetical protein